LVDFRSIAGTESSRPILGPYVWQRLKVSVRGQYGQLVLARHCSDNHIHLRQRTATTAKFVEYLTVEPGRIRIEGP
jgi:hypothetical protein